MAAQSKPQSMSEIVESTEVVKSKRVRKPKQIASEESPAPVETVTVNAGLWETAVKLAKGDKRKIKILAHNRVIVG